MVSSQNNRHFAEDILKVIVVKENCCVVTEL